MWSHSFNGHNNVKTWTSRQLGWFKPPLKWFQVLYILKLWFCCCVFIVCCCPHCLWELSVTLALLPSVLCSFPSESWLLYFCYVLNAILWLLFFVNSTRSHWLVCGVRLWHYLVILTYLESKIYKYKKRKKAKIRNWYNKASHLTWVQIWLKPQETSSTRKPRVQTFPAGDHNAANNRQYSITTTNIKHKQQRSIHKRSTILKRLVKNTGDIKHVSQYLHHLWFWCRKRYIDV